MTDNQLIIMASVQRRRAAGLIRDSCANFALGRCVVLDTACVQILSESLLCNYFKNAVLPLDGALHAQLMGIGTEGLKACAVCGRPFKANSNRGRYCPECAAKERRRKEAARQARRRAGK